MRLRNWQQRFVRDYFERRQVDYLLEATPGAGKTNAAAAIAQRALVGSVVEQVLVVVPRIPLRRQTADVFAAFDVDLRPNWNANESWPADAHGLVITYAALASQPALMRQFVTRAPTLVVFDEVHHGCDETSWGEAMQTACADASLRLLMSGTPFRTAGTRIPFVHYVETQAVPDFAYGYRDALRDRVVRAVNFIRHGGRMEWLYNDREYRAQIEDDLLSERDARRALRTAVDPTGGWVDTTLREAHSAVTNMRRSDPTAAANYQAATQQDAKTIAAKLRAIVGDDTGVVLAVSNEEDAAERIAAFRDGTAPWLVSCDMVTEGVDIPRLRVLVYAKHELTAMVFRQVVGRVVRLPDESHDHAAVFIPDHPVLRAHALEIEQQVVAWLDEEIERVEHDAEALEHVQPLFAPTFSEATDDGVIAREGQGYEAHEWQYAERVKLQHALTAALNTETVLQLLRNAGQVAARPPSREPESTELPRYQTEQRLRSLNAQVARRVAHACADGRHDQVNAQANRAVGVRSVKGATIEQLRLRLRYLQHWFNDGSPPAANVAL